LEHKHSSKLKLVHWNDQDQFRTDNITHHNQKERFLPTLTVAGVTHTSLIKSIASSLATAVNWFRRILYVHLKRTQRRDQRPIIIVGHVGQVLVAAVALGARHPCPVAGAIAVVAVAHASVVVTPPMRRALHKFSGSRAGHHGILTVKNNNNNK
jgi:hypothetical protein